MGKALQENQKDEKVACGGNVVSVILPLRNTVMNLI